MEKKAQRSITSAVLCLSGVAADPGPETLCQIIMHNPTTPWIPKVSGVISVPIMRGTITYIISIAAQVPDYMLKYFSTPHRQLSGIVLKTGYARWLRACRGERFWHFEGSAWQFGWLAHYYFSFNIPTSSSCQNPNRYIS